MHASLHSWKPHHVGGASTFSAAGSDSISAALTNGTRPNRMRKSVGSMPYAAHDLAGLVIGCLRTRDQDNVTLAQAAGWLGSRRRRRRKVSRNLSKIRAGVEAAPRIRDIFRFQSPRRLSSFQRSKWPVPGGGCHVVLQADKASRRIAKIYRTLTALDSPRSMSS